MTHPWLAKDANLSKVPIRNSAELLERFQRGRRRLRASILGVLLSDALGDDATSDVETTIPNAEEPLQETSVASVKQTKLTDRITWGISSNLQALSEKADALLSTLDVFDKDRKGFITKNDLARVSKKLGKSLSDSELNEMLVGATGDPEKKPSTITAIGYEDVKLAISSLRSASYNPGEVIIREGHTGNHVYLLLDGEVEVSCKNPIKPSCPKQESPATEPTTVESLSTESLPAEGPAPDAASSETSSADAINEPAQAEDRDRISPAPQATATTTTSIVAEEEEVTLKRLHRGSFFGEMELLKPDGQLHPRIATYKCASSENSSPCKVLQLVADDFLNVSGIYSSINEKVESSARSHTQEQLIKCVEATKGSVQRHELQPGDFVYHEGEECDSFFIILEGEVQVLRQREQVVVEDLHAGDYFPLGVSGMTSNCKIHSRHYSVRCTQPTKVIEIGGETFRSFLHSNQFMASYFRQEIKRREQMRQEKHTQRTSK
ncbi:hypothetical protein PINS_up004009 [Pythium insidiosum]|nr:hypothetical protein PINS_up004009 [Pythium insidiosum]